MKHVLLWFLLIFQYFGENECSICNPEVSCGEVFSLGHNSPRSNKNGEIIEHGEFPWRVDIFYKDERDSKYKYVCAGTLVSQTHVVTAANCIFLDKKSSSLDVDRLSLVFGTHDNKNCHEPGRINVGVSKISSTQSFSESESNDEIVILVLEEEIQLTKYVQPICLFETTSTDAFDVTPPSWGITEWSDSHQEQFSTKVIVKIQSDVGCNKMIGKMRNHNLKQDFCTNVENGTVCGDRGSGLAVIYDNLYYLKGVLTSTVCNAERSNIYVSPNITLDNLPHEKKCDSAEFLCDGTKCLSNELKCDGTPNCEDFTDEKGCKSTSAPIPRPKPAAQKASNRESVIITSSNGIEIKKHIGNVGETIRLKCLPNPYESVTWSKQGSLKLPVNVNQFGNDLVIRVSTVKNTGTYVCNVVFANGLLLSAIVEVKIDTSKCRKFEFNCDETKCLPKNFMCDGREDCEDGTDEEGCGNDSTTPETTTLRPLTTTTTPELGLLETVTITTLDGTKKSKHSAIVGENIRFVCSPTPYENVKWSKSRSTTLLENVYQYGNDIEIKNSATKNSGIYVCTVAFQNGKVLSAKIEVEIERTDCRKFEFGCDNMKCLPKSMKCNEMQDCEDGTDEINCGAVYEGCYEFEFGCDGNRCVPNSLKCSEYQVCDDGSDKKNCPDVSKIPSFTHQSLGNVELECNAIDGSIIKWSRTDGKKLPSNAFPDGNRLVIENIIKDDEGLYQCVAYHPSQNETIRIFPSIRLSKLKISFSQESPVVLNSGESTSIDCVATGKTPIKIIWQKENGQALTGSTRAQGKTLMFNSVSKADEGHYVCKASNSEEITTKIAEVFVTGEGEKPSAPEILISPPKITQNEFTIVEIRCIATGYPKPSIEWTRTSGKLSNDVVNIGGYLKFNSLLMSDAGTYHCAASNNAGASEKSVEIKVIQGSPILPHTIPESVTITSMNGVKVTKHLGNQGENARFKCITTPNRNVEWSKEGSKLLPRNVNQIINDLRVQNSNADNSGTYVCSATFQSGNTLKSQVEVVVGTSNDQPPKITPFANLTETIVPGKNFELTCESSGTPPPEITWFREDGLSFESNVRQNGNVLIILNARLRNHGVYVCRAINRAGEDAISVKIVLEELPTIVIQPGKTLEIECFISDDLKIFWRRTDGLKISSSAVIKGKRLLIQNVRESDAASYECFAIDSSTHEEIPGPITTVYIPHLRIVFSQQMPMIVSSNEFTSVYCHVIGKNPIEVTWHRENGAEFSSSTEVAGRYLKFNSISAKDQGKYVCKASNEYEKISDVAEVIVKEPQPDTLNIIIKPGKKVEFSCNSDDSLNIKWRRVDGKSLPENAVANGNKLVIQNVDNDDDGSYECVVFDLKTNEFILYSTTNVVIATPPKIYFSPPMPLEVQTGDSVTVYCLTTGKGPTKTLWRSEDYEASPNSFVTNGNFLKFDSISKDDQGQFVCSSSNSFGKATAVAEIIVKEISLPKVSIYPTNIKRETQSIVELYCSVTSSTAIKWERTDGKMSQDVIISGGYLKFNSILLSDAGTYRCSASNNAGVAEKTIDIKVIQAAPKNTVVITSFSGEKLEDKMFVNPGQKLRFKCLPTPSEKVKWSKSGSKNLPRNVYQRDTELEIQNPSFYDSGTYFCIVKFRSGKTVTSQVEVVVNEPPRISDLEKQTESIVQGKNFELNCETSGTPIPVVSWSRADGNPFESNVRQNGSVLMIINAKPENSGVYVCRAINRAGKDEVSVEIKIKVPKTKPKPEIIQILPSETAEFDCGSDENVKVEWRRNDGKPLPAKSIKLDAKLIIRNFVATDVGVYECVTYDEDVDQLIVLKIVSVVVVPIKIDFEQEMPMQVEIDENSLIKCIPTGKGKITVAWAREDGKALSNNVRIYDRILMFDPVTLADKGKYVCTATNAFGSSSKTAEIVIKDVIPPSTQIVFENYPLRINIVIENLPAVDHFEWNREYLSLPSGSHFIDNNLIIPHVSLDDGGRYICKIFFKDGQMSKAEVIVVVKTIIHQTVHFGEQIVLNCEVDAKVTQYYWKRSDKKALPAGSKQNFGELLIESAKSDAAGSYECIGRHEDTKAWITVSKTQISFARRPPSIVFSPAKSTHVKTGDFFSLTCNAFGDEPISISWSRSNGQDLPSSINVNDKHLIFNSISPADQDLYLCTAQNAHGKSTMDAEVFVSSTSVKGKSYLPRNQAN